jgi:hypothetical protein
MQTSNQISRLVQKMLADGAEHDAIVRAVQTAELAVGKNNKRSSTAKGARLPDDWCVPSEFIGYATSQGMPEDRALLEVEKFKNYWTAKAGAAAVKRDWFATWRNWILNAMEARHVASSYRPAGGVSTARRPPTGADAVLAGMGRLADRLVERRNAAGRDDGQMEDDANLAGQLDFKGGRT